MIRSIFLLCVVITINGCASGYEPDNFDGGYSETRLDENVFLVTFRGNSSTPRTQTEDFALLRSAELTLDNGFNYFSVVKSNQDTKHSSYTTPLVANTNAYGVTTFTGGQTYYSTSPTTSLTIVCFVSKPSQFAYNANFIVESVKDKYEIKDLAPTPPRDYYDEWE